MYINPERPRKGAGTIGSPGTPLRYAAGALGRTPGCCASDLAASAGQAGINRKNQGIIGIGIPELKGEQAITGAIPQKTGYRQLEAVRCRPSLIRQ
jgi:hypothetical protein